jgi:hypothetical protein
MVELYLHSPLRLRGGKHCLLRWGGMDWINLPRYGDRWWAVVNTVMNFRVP